jgi:hypothetical protein
MKRAAAIAAVTTALLATSAPLAAAAPPPASSPLTRLAGGDRTGLRIDDRYAIFTDLFSGPGMQIRDTKTGKTTAYDDGCGLPPTNDSYRRGHMLLACPSGHAPRFEVVDVGDLSVVPVPNVPDDVQMVGVGEQWAAGWRGKPDGTGQATVYVNWHSGETRTVPGPMSARVPLDLDDPALRARRVGSERGDPFPLRRGRLSLTTDESGALLLHDGRTTKRLGRCAADCDSAQLGPGIVVWTASRAIHGYGLHTGKRFRWPARGKLLHRPRAVATGYELYVSDFKLRAPGVKQRLFVTRWRRAR